MLLEDADWWVEHRSCPECGDEVERCLRVTIVGTDWGVECHSHDCSFETLDDYDPTPSERPNTMPMPDTPPGRIR